VHPLARATAFDDACASQIGQMAADLGLRLGEDLDQGADAEFFVAHEVEQAQAGEIAEGLKEEFLVEVVLFGWHGLYIRLDEYVSKE
jgi:hypothetical protein